MISVSGSAKGACCARSDALAWRGARSTAVASLFSKGNCLMQVVEVHADEARYDRLISLRLSRQHYENGCRSQLHLRDLRANHPGGWRDISPVEASKIVKPPEGPMLRPGAASSVDGWLLEHGTSALPFSLKTAMAARFSPSALNSRR
jgi:hypothetical protein